MRLSYVGLQTACSSTRVILLTVHGDLNTNLMQAAEIHD